MKIPKLCLENKHADFKLHRNEDFVYVWLDNPVRGQALSVTFQPENWPALTVITCTNTEAKKDAALSIKKYNFKNLSW